MVLDGAESASARLDFKVSGFFLFGSPLGLVLALRKTVMPAMDGEVLLLRMAPVCNHRASPSLLLSTQTFVAILLSTTF